MTYAQLLSGLMEAILTGDVSGAETYLRGKPDFPAVQGLKVYTEGYRLRLREALEGTYPALQEYLGSPAFTALAEGFITANPSRHFNLDRHLVAFGAYGAEVSEDDFARELALLEAAIHDVYQLPETPAVSSEWAARQTPESLAATVLLPRAASAPLAFHYPVEDYFAAFRAGEKPARPPRQESFLLVLRDRHQVKRLALEKAEYALLLVLGEGQALAQALEDARLEPFLDERFPAALQRYLQRWVTEGVVRQPS